jgi:hypothetical protein
MEQIEKDFFDIYRNDKNYIKEDDFKTYLKNEYDYKQKILIEEDKTKVNPKVNPKVENKMFK